MKKAAEPNTGKASENTASAWASWQESFANLEAPSRIALSEQADFDRAMAMLDSANVLPLFAMRLKESESWSLVSAERRSFLEKSLAKSKAGTSVFLVEIKRITGALHESGLEPILLKGADLVLRYYDKPYLRPMSDMDLLFPDLSHADRAREVLLRLGYKDEASFVSGSPWRWNNYHLPAMQNPQTGGHIEIHGGLLFPLTDPRSAKAALLYEEIDIYSWDGICMYGLRPEANLLYMFAHSFVQHSGEPPTLRLICDTRRILEMEKGRFDWGLWRDLADRSDLLEPGLVGLEILNTSAGISLPDFIRGEIERFGEKELVKVSSAPDRRDDGLEDLKLLFRSPQSESLPVRIARLLFPGGEFMRHRYPDKGGWPLMLLYPYRWVAQLARLSGSVSSWALGRLRKKSRATLP